MHLHRVQPRGLLMIRVHRIAATAQDDASLISGWNIAPNLEYSVVLTPGPASCGVFLFEGGRIVASGAALVGTEQPCVLIPHSGQVLGMVDADLGWHLRLTTTGAEQQRTIGIGPAVDLPDEIHPVYADDALALARATAGIDASARYIDDLTVSCPLGLGAGLGAIAGVPVDGAAVIGQVEGITWAGTPNGASDQAVIRRYVAIAPTPHFDPVPVTPPAVTDDTGETTADETTSGNVLINDGEGLFVIAVNGLVENVGELISGDNGGVFTVGSDGAWTFDPNGDFSALTGTETAETSVAYYASDGTGEASATLTVTVSAPAPVVVDGYRFLRLQVTAVMGTGSYLTLRHMYFYDAGNNRMPHVDLTSNTSPAPYAASAHSRFSTTYDFFKAFTNGTTSADSNRWLAENKNVPGWVTLDMGDGSNFLPTSVVVAPGALSSGTVFPTAFEIWGSQTGEFTGEHDVLYSASGLTSGWAAGQPRTFIF